MTIDPITNPRPEQPGENWRDCIQQERAYTDGYRDGRAGSVYRCPKGTLTKAQAAYRLGHLDGNARGKGGAL